MLRYFTRRQRIGILSLFFLVFLMQIILIFASNNEFIAYQLDKNTLINLEQEYDSLYTRITKKRKDLNAFHLTPILYPHTMAMN